MGVHSKPRPLCGSSVRKCMKCQEEFSSEGNAVCDGCQKKNKGLSVLGGKYVAGSCRLKSVEGTR